VNEWGIRVLDADNNKNWIASQLVLDGKAIPAKDSSFKED